MWKKNFYCYRYHSPEADPKGKKNVSFCFRTNAQYNSKSSLIAISSSLSSHSKAFHPQEKINLAAEVLTIFFRQCPVAETRKWKPHFLLLTNFQTGKSRCYSLKYSLFLLNIFIFTAQFAEALLSRYISLSWLKVNWPYNMLKWKILLKVNF